jgi:hypothetical protein
VKLPPEQAFNTFLNQLRSIEDAGERAAYAENIFGANTAKLLPVLESASVANIAQAATTTTTTAALAEEAVAAEGLSAALATATVATEAEAVASIGLGEGMLLAAGAVIAIGLAIFQSTAAQHEANSVSKETIDLTQKRITQIRVEIAALEENNAANQAEREERKAVIETKRAELALNQELARGEEKAQVQALVSALVNEKQAQYALILANHGVIGSVEEAGEAHDKTRKKVKSAVDGLIDFSLASGKSRAEILRNEIALLKQAATLGFSHNQLEAVAAALRAVAADENYASSSTDTHTAAIERQIGALRQQRAELELNATLREEVVKTNFEQIANMGLTESQAKKELDRRRRLSVVPGMNQATGLPVEGLDNAIRVNQRVGKLMETLNNVANPPSGGGGGGGDGEAAAQRAARQALEIAQVDLQTAERIAQEKLEAEKRHYDESLEDARQYAARRKEIEEERYKSELATFQKEQTLLDQSPLDAGEKAVKQKQLTEKEAASASKHTRTLADIEFDKNKTIEEMDKAHNEARIQLMEDGARQLEQQQVQAVKHGLSTFIEAENARFAAEQEILTAKLQALYDRLGHISSTSPEAAKINDDIARLAQQRQGSVNEHGAKTEDARAKDLADAQSYSQKLRAIYATVIDITRETASIELKDLEGNYLRRAELIRKQAALERAAESERSRRIVAELSDRRRVLDLERQMTDEAGGNSHEQVALISAIDRQIEAEKRKSAAIQTDIDRQMQDKLKEKWRQVAGDLATITQDAFKGGWRAVLGDFQKMLDQIEHELLNSVFIKILTGEDQGSSAGGIVGAVTNKLLSIIGIGKDKKQDSEQVANTVAVDVNSTATDRNTLAIEQLTMAMHSQAGGASAGAGSAGGGLLSAILSGVLSGLVGGLAGGIGGGSPGDGGRFSTSVLSAHVNAPGGGNLGGIPFLGPFGGARADGGPVSAGSLYRINENGEEFFMPHLDGNVFNQNQVDGNGGGSGGNQQAMNVNIHFKLPPGPVTPQMQHQISSAALSGMERAMRRR